jgi:hypothetical protein
MAVVDHLGNKFNTMTEMCEYHGISNSTLSRRLKAGMNLEQALKKVSNERFKVVCHEGVEHASIKAMCAFYGVSVRTYEGRRRNGKRLKDALEKVDVSKLSTPFRSVPVVCYLGVKHKSTSAMCRHYGVDRNLYASRLRRGLSLRAALIPEQENGRRVRDHEGNEFKNLVQMCSYWGVSVRRYAGRKRLGWSLERSLTEKPLHNRGRQAIVFNGMRFESKSALSSYYGVSSDAFLSRCKRGWSLGEALGITGRGLDSKIRKGEQLNALLYVENKLRSYVGRDKRMYFCVVVKDTGQILFRNSDQILEFKGV